MGHCPQRDGSPRNDVINASLVELRLQRLRGNADLPDPVALPFVLFGELVDPNSSDSPSPWDEWRAAVNEPSAESVRTLSQWLHVRSSVVDATCIPQDGIDRRP